MKEEERQTAELRRGRNSDNIDEGDEKFRVQLRRERNNKFRKEKRR